MSLTELIGAAWWPWVTGALFLIGTAVNMAAVVLANESPRTWIHATHATFGAVIGGHWIWLAIDPGLDRAMWSEGLTPWSAAAGIAGVGCLSALHDLSMWWRIRQQEDRS